MTDRETFFFTIFNSLLIILGSCANLLVTGSFILFSSIREGTRLFLVSLSVADFLICAVYQPLLVFRFSHPDQNQFFLSTQTLLGYGLFSASMNGLLSVTFDRFVAIYFPYKYLIWITSRNTAIMISISWFVSLVMGIINCINNTRSRIVSHLYATTIIIVVPILYGIIYKEAIKQTRLITVPSAAGRLLFINKATRGVGIVLLITLLCWLPVIIFPALAASLGTDEDIHRMLMWCLTAGCANSCINPFIYYYKFQSFRRSAKKSFQRIWREFGGRFSLNSNRHNSAKVYPSPNLDQMKPSHRLASAWIANNGPSAAMWGIC